MSFGRPFAGRPVTSPSAASPVPAASSTSNNNNNNNNNNTTANSAASMGDVRPLQRNGPRCTSSTLTSTLPRPQNSAGGERRTGGAMKGLHGSTDNITHILQRELCNAAMRNEPNSVGTTREGSSGSHGNSNGQSGMEYTGPLTPDKMQSALSMIIKKQNSEWDSRRYSLLERRDIELVRARRRATAAGDTLNSNKSTESCCMLLHTLLEESRRQWGELLSTRVNALKREVRHGENNNSNNNKNGNDNNKNMNDDTDSEDVEWSAMQLYNILLAGVNSNATEKLLHTLRLINADSCNDAIDAFGLLTVFRAPIQELLIQHEALAPSLTTLRHYFAALHPSNGSPKATAYTEPSLHDAEVNLHEFLQHGGTPETIAKALRGTVSPSLRRLLYARALQLPLTATDGVSLFGGRGELQANQHGDFVAGNLTFATKYCRDKVKRRLHHSYSTKSQESTAKLLQAIVKIDNLQSVGNNDRYFIFSDETELLGISLVLDKSIPDVRLGNTLRQLGRPQQQVESYLVFLEDSMDENTQQQQQQQQQQQKQQQKQILRTPPSGFFPLRNSTMLIAPLCYVTGDTVEQYELVSAFFGQLWSRIQGPTPELLQCCWVFEALTTRFAAAACLHATRTLRYPPLRLAIPWILSAFTEVLEPAELLSFWDLILSYHVEEMFSDIAALSLPVDESLAERREGTCRPSALWLLPLLAASLFVYRAPLVERCATADEMLLVFKEAHHVRCRPLLQYLLFMAK
ncbi:TBC1 domain family, member 19 [Trypanosoma theileri]|uniref:TBC1 domain family, member 19 n=1 Tax=Trypanosoma theileri TaxID=67003 RepID=A0A1X0NU07_9TRYP|nr:TBC1 domain family, member 19 [Trypanosoma theileri]ORC88196.1 TBC1 domain family, member 19 [Trypanosoma theileri]